MEKELQNFKIARFALNSTFEEIGAENIDQLKRHLLDAIGSLVHATGKPAIHKLVRQMQVIG
jgi:2-methylcitrate dehydratase